MDVFAWINNPFKGYDIFLCPPPDLIPGYGREGGRQGASPPPLIFIILRERALPLTTAIEKETWKKILQHFLLKCAFLGPVSFVFYENFCSSNFYIFFFNGWKFTHSELSQKNRFLQRTERWFQCTNSQSDSDKNLVC